jgi:hypothetical protein
MYSEGRSMKDHQKILGGNLEVADIVEKPYRFLQCREFSTHKVFDSQLDARDATIVVESNTIPLMIDYGTLMVSHIPRESSMATVLDVLGRFFHHEFKADMLPRFVIGSVKPNFLHHRFQDWYLPLMTPIQRVYTTLDSRAHEQLNPAIINYKDGRSRFLGLYSELSDVFSMATVLISRLIGFDPFSRYVPMNMHKLRDTDPEFHVGIPVSTTFFQSTSRGQGFGLYRMEGVFSSMLAESAPPKGRSSAEGADLRKSGIRQSSDDVPKFNARGVADTHCYFNDDDNVRWSYFAPPYNPSTKLLYTDSLYAIVDKYLRERLPKVDDSSQWYAYRNDTKEFKDDELIVEVFSIVARIEALGIPDPEECRGKKYFSPFAVLLENHSYVFLP